MKLGVTGHQARRGAHWDWVKAELHRTLAGKIELTGYSSLAIGADQLFAECVIERGGRLIAVIPIANYRSLFNGRGAENFDRLCSLSTVVDLNLKTPDEIAFLEAGKWIAREVDLLIAVWDGEEAEGRGGTGDIVAYACSIGRRVLQVDLMRRATKFLP